jgi:hypothetical protein
MFNLILDLNHLINKACTSSHVGPIVVGVLPQEQEVTSEELGG